MTFDYSVGLYNAFKIKKACYPDDEISLEAYAVHASIVQSLFHRLFIKVYSLFYTDGEYVFV